MSRAPEQPSGEQTWFDTGGDAYRRARPTMPAVVAERLGERCLRHRLAVDVGCGSGQLTTALLGVFERAVGVDASQSQLDAASPHPRADYRRGTASALPLPTGSADLIAACQAAHWFELERFTSECRRVAAPGAPVVLLGYGVPTIEGPAGPLLERLYWDDLHSFWPSERRLVEQHYRDLDLALAPLDLPRLPPAIERSWSAGQLVDYVRTWSACRKAALEGHGHIRERFEVELAQRWLDGSSQPIRWPIFGRAWRASPPTYT